MVSLDLPLDLAAPDADAFLRDIQGNIIKGHGRDFTAHFITRMTGQPDAVRKWISSFGASHVTTAKASRQMTSLWHAEGGVGEPFAMFLLSADGYRYLGVDPARIPIAGGEFKRPVHDEYFRRGMKGQASIPVDFPQEGRGYIDPPPVEWEPPYRGTIHAMILLADDGLERLEKTIASLQHSLEGLFEIVTVERGAVLTADFPRGSLVIEHFGFQDGVSQPLMIKQDIELEVLRRGDKHWDPTAPLSLALAREPGDQEHYGSFIVFRKLEQDVRGFWDAIDELSANSGIPAELVGAMATGRHRDGTPLVPTVTNIPSDPTIDPNDFHFDQDPDGALCPFHAHIRKTNPRGDIPRVIGAPTEFEKARRIVRRGITYGERADLREKRDGRPLPSEGVGLLFMCFQSNLDQFVIQQEGSDSNEFVKESVGVDAVIGRNVTPLPQKWPSTGTTNFLMANFVRMKGGEYFFAPSISYLKGLVQE